MSVSLDRLDRRALSELSVTLRNAGLAGAGGAGFPTHAKWNRIDEVDYLLVNQQESEPNYYIDKWIAREKAPELATLFDALLERAFDAVVVGAKLKDRAWLHDLEVITDATVYRPADLPIDPDDESGVVVAYTEDQYQTGMESVLLQRVADVVLGQDLPMDHGWIVQNTETLYRIYRTLEDNEPMTRKYVHVDGDVPSHRFFDVPVGTPASVLLREAGLSPDELPDDRTLLDGGPGWCFVVETPPDRFGVRKRTNCLLVADADRVTANTLGNDRVNILEEDGWETAEHERAPTRLDPDRVRIPLLTNPAFEGIVGWSRPIVEVGETVERGEMIATPPDDGIGNTHHASIGGEVVDVTDTHVEIARTADDAVAVVGRQIYWTWCAECGAYAPMPDPDELRGQTRYVCDDCR